jgi:hypothetical protein
MRAGEARCRARVDGFIELALLSRGKCFQITHDFNVIVSGATRKLPALQTLLDWAGMEIAYFLNKSFSIAPGVWFIYFGYSAVNNVNAALPQTRHSRRLPRSFLARLPEKFFQIPEVYNS